MTLIIWDALVQNMAQISPEVPMRDCQSKKNPHGNISIEKIQRNTDVRTYLRLTRSGLAHVALNISSLADFIARAYS
jgi:hypothetical protein